VCTTAEKAAEARKRHFFEVFFGKKPVFDSKVVDRPCGAMPAELN
jgi:hypothetical protein